MNVCSIISVKSIYDIIIDYLEYQEFFEMAIIFYKILGKESSINSLCEHSIIKGIYLELSAFDYFAWNIPKWVLNKSVINNNYKMISFLIENGISFDCLPQETLNKIVLYYNCKMVSILFGYKNLFVNLPQDILNQVILNDNYIMIMFLRINGVSFQNTPQEVLNNIILHSKQYLTITELQKNGVSFKNIPQSIKLDLLSSINNDNFIKIDILYTLLKEKVSFVDIPQFLINYIAINKWTSTIIEILIEEHGISFANIPQDIIDKIALYNEEEKISILKRNGVIF